MSNTIDPKFSRLVGRKIKFEAQFNKITRTRKGNARIVLLNVKEADTGAKFRDHVNFFVNMAEGTELFQRLQKNDKIHFIATVTKYRKKEEVLGVQVMTENFGFKDITKVVRVESYQSKKAKENNNKPLKIHHKPQKGKVMTDKERSLYDNYQYRKNLFKSLARNGNYFKLTKDLNDNDVVVIFNRKNKKVKFITLDKIKPKYQRVLDENFAQIMSLLAINYRYYSRSVAKKENLSQMKLDRLFFKDLKKFEEFL